LYKGTTVYVGSIFYECSDVHVNSPFFAPTTATATTSTTIPWCTTMVGHFVVINITAIRIRVITTTITTIRAATTITITATATAATAATAATTATTTIRVITVITTTTTTTTTAATTITITTTATAATAATAVTTATATTTTTTTTGFCPGKCSTGLYRAVKCETGLYTTATAACHPFGGSEGVNNIVVFIDFWCFQ
jgi:hypothetical protein